ncbi:MAG TPA: hypothetical protein VIZ70_04765 [Propionibacteriaceae bacterium]
MLELDLPAPTLGWLIELDRRGITVLADDLGRKAISRGDARMLLDEQREDEDRAREVAARREQQLIQQDRLRRASLPTGIPAGMVPDGLRPAEAMMLAGESSAPRARSVREQLLERELSHRTEPELIYQPIGPDEG